MTNFLRNLMMPRTLNKDRSFWAELKTPWEKSDNIRTAIFAALYISITMAILPIAFGMFQVRVSEAIAMLAYDSKYGGRPVAIGVLVGGVIVSLFGPSPGLDTMIGIPGAIITLSLVWWFGIYFKGNDLGKIVSGIVFSTIVAFQVGFVLLHKIIGVPAAPAITGVLIGELISAGVLGFILLKALQRTYMRKKKVE